MQNWIQSYKRKVLFSWCILKEGSFDLVSDYAWEITLQNKKENELPRAILLAWELTTKINPWPTLFSLTLAWNSICRWRWFSLWRRLRRALLPTYLTIPSFKCLVDWALILGLSWESLAICFNKRIGCWTPTYIIRVGSNQKPRWGVANTTSSGKFQCISDIRTKDTEWS